MTVRKIINKLVMRTPKGEYEFAGGNGSGTTPGPDSVGSEQIQDEGVKMQDLDKDIQDKLEVLDESNVVSEEDINDMWEEAMQNAGLDTSGGGTAIDASEVSDDDIQDMWNDAMQNASGGTQEAGAGSAEVSGGGGGLDE